MDIKKYVQNNATVDNNQLYIPGFGWIDDHCSDLEWRTAAMHLASDDLKSQAAFMAETGEIDADSLQITLDILNAVRSAS